MQYIEPSGLSKPLLNIEEAASREPVAFDGPKGTAMVAMTLGDYNRLLDARVQAFKNAWNTLSAEAAHNGLTPELLNSILSDAQ